VQNKHYLWMVLGLSAWLWSGSLASLPGQVPPLQTPPEQPPPAPVLPAPLPEADLQDNPVSLEPLKGKVTAVVLSSQDNEQEISTVSRELLAALNSDRDRYAFVSIMDLGVVPDFAREVAVGIIEGRLEQADRDLASRLELSGQKLAPGVKLQLPDWNGERTLAWLQASPDPEYAVFRGNPRSRFERERTEREQQRLRSYAQVFVLHWDFTLKAHFSGRSAGAKAAELMRALAQQASTAPDLSAIHSPPLRSHRPPSLSGR
jgi:hypothetical protein